MRIVISVLSIESIVRLAGIYLCNLFLAFIFLLVANANHPDFQRFSPVSHSGSIPGRARERPGDTQLTLLTLGWAQPLCPVSSI